MTFWASWMAFTGVLLAGLACLVLGRAERKRRKAVDEAHLQGTTDRARADDAVAASERRYRRLFEAARDGILILDAITGQIVDVNPFLVELTGYSKEELLARTLWEIGLFKDVAASKESFAELQAREYIRYDDLPLRTRDGRQVDVEFVSNVYLVDDDKVIQCNIRDVTARKLAESQLLKGEAERGRLREQLVISQKLESIGTLASGVAHEINNPLNIILNYGQLLLDGATDPVRVRDFALNIVKESERVAGIVSNLLNFARQERETFSPGRMADIVERTLSLTRAVLRKDQIAVQSDVDQGLPVIRCRSQQIQQVLMNLLTNSRDALNARYPGASPDKIIRISAARFEKDGLDWVRLTVEDHGGGIPADVAERVFDPFFTTKGRDKGTGLGLSISYNIVREHHGAISFETTPEKGTRFHVDLQVHDGRPQPALLAS